MQYTVDTPVSVMSQQISYQASVDAGSNFAIRKNAANDSEILVVTSTGALAYVARDDQSPTGWTTTVQSVQAAAVGSPAAQGTSYICSPADNNTVTISKLTIDESNYTITATESSQITIGTNAIVPRFMNILPASDDQDFAGIILNTNGGMDGPLYGLTSGANPVQYCFNQGFAVDTCSARAIGTASQNASDFQFFGVNPSNSGVWLVSAGGPTGNIWSTPDICSRFKLVVWQCFGCFPFCVQAVVNANSQTFTCELINDCQHPYLLAITQAIRHKVIAPDMILPARAQPDARPVIQIESPALLLSLGNLQPFLTPDAFHAFMVDRPPFCAQQGSNAFIAISAITVCQADDIIAQSAFIIRLTFDIALNRAAHTERMTRSAL